MNIIIWNFRSALKVWFFPLSIDTICINRIIQTWFSFRFSWSVYRKV